MFAPQKPKVYGKALASVTGLTPQAALWNPRPAVVDQLGRASESVVLNIAEGNGRYPDGDRRRFLDLAEGSAVKAAASLDRCHSQAELGAGPLERGVGLLARVALRIRGLASV